MMNNELSLLFKEKLAHYLASPQRMNDALCAIESVRLDGRVIGLFELYPYLNAQGDISDSAPAKLNIYFERISYLDKFMPDASQLEKLLFDAAAHTAEHEVICKKIPDTNGLPSNNDDLKKVIAFNQSLDEMRVQVLDELAPFFKLSNQHGRLHIDKSFWLALESSQFPHVSVKHFLSLHGIVDSTQTVDEKGEKISQLSKMLISELSKELSQLYNQTIDEVSHIATFRTCFFARPAVKEMNDFCKQLTDSVERYEQPQQRTLDELSQTLTTIAGKGQEIIKALHQNSSSKSEKKIREFTTSLMQKIDVMQQLSHYIDDMMNADPHYFRYAIRQQRLSI